MNLQQIIEDDIIKLITIKDVDNRGLSDRMLFYLNAYISSKNIIDDSIREKILYAANDAVKEYNLRSYHPPFSILFFELYYSILKRYSKKSKILYLDCKLFEIDKFDFNNEREFINLYHSFGIYWCQKSNISKYIKDKCKECDNE